MTISVGVCRPGNLAQRGSVNGSKKRKCGETRTLEHLVLYDSNAEEQARPEQARPERAILRSMEARDIVNEGLLLVVFDRLADKISKIVTGNPTATTNLKRTINRNWTMTKQKLLN